jgi:hypothetical protein
MYNSSDSDIDLLDIVQKVQKGKGHATLPRAPDPKLSMPQGSTHSQYVMTYGSNSFNDVGRLLYPSFPGFTIPPVDSDYDEQPVGFEPVDTDVMPLDCQDPKLK